MGKLNCLINFWSTFLILSVLVFTSEQMFLKQVVILSRHSVKTPRTHFLLKTSSKPWPKWNGTTGLLTPKGVLLEGQMGKYFYLWLNEENLLPAGCPTEKEFFVYASNSLRSLDTAESFVSNAFPLCNVTVHHAIDVDLILNPFIRNSSSLFLQEATSIMQEKINNIHFNNQSFRALEELLDYKNSQNCIKNLCCDLVTDNNTAVVITGSRPRIRGPLDISKYVIDSFITEYYEGFKMADVAWGLLNTEEKWQPLLDLKHLYHNLLFNTTIVARDISEPLRKYLLEVFTSENAPKVTLLMGHSVSIFTIFNAMGFKPYKLREQREITPIGGKIVFQRWSNNGTNDFLKIDYVYQPWEDMREGKILSLENPPLFERLELNNCNVDSNGLCPWGEFESLLKNNV